MNILKNSDYKRWVSELKLRIQQSQIKASIRVNSSLIELYWSIGADIVAKQAETVWGSGVFAKMQYLALIPWRHHVEIMRKR